MKSTFSQKVTVYKVSIHKQSEKTTVCFKTRCVSACDFTVLNSTDTYTDRNILEDSY